MIKKETLTLIDIAEIRITLNNETQFTINIQMWYPPFRVKKYDVKNKTSNKNKTTQKLLIVPK